MDKINIENVQLTPLLIIDGELGNVMHALKKTEPNFSEFGEAYFSTVHCGKIKGWKKHRQMTLNLVVPVGKIKFVIYDDRSGAFSKNQFFEVCLSPENYQRLTVPPQVWMGFQGVSSSLNLLLNLASIPHDPDETESCDLKDIPYSW